MRGIAAQFVLAVLAAACGLAFAPAFGGRLHAGDIAPSALIVAVAVAALVPALLVATARMLRVEALLAATAALVVTAVVIVLVTRPGTAVFSGGYRLLTSALPASADAPARATVAALTAFAALVAAMIAAYGRIRALAVAPSFACLLAALALDSGIRQPPIWYGAVVVGLVGAALALLREPVRRTNRDDSRVAGVRIIRGVFPLVGAAAILAAGALVAAALSSDLPAVRHTAADARDLVDAPLRPRNAIEPMVEFPAFAKDRDRVRLSGTASRRVDRLTLVTLATFTGRTWTTAARYRRAGRTLSDTAAARPVTVSLRVAAADGLSWLLRPERPSSVDRDGLGTDEATGDLVVPAGTPYPTRYRVTGSAPIGATDALGEDSVTAWTGPVASAAGPPPAVVLSFAEALSKVPHGYPPLPALADRLRGGDFYIDDTANPPSGNGYIQVQTLLDAAGKHVGTSEQYASAFAIMARVLGYDSRLVLGFQPEYAKSGNRFTVAGRDVHAWVQVHFSHAGWVTFDPTPTRSAKAARNKPDPAGASPKPSKSAPSSSAPATPKPSSASARADSASRSGNSTLVALLAGLAVLVVLVAAPPTAKAGRRRRRRGAAIPAHAVYGAWRETTDRLGEGGAPPPHGRSTRDVAGAAPPSVRGDVQALGALLDKAGYAPEAAARDDARTAWEHADTTAHALRQSMSPGRRVLAALDPRPLWRR